MCSKVILFILSNVRVVDRFIGDNRISVPGVNHVEVQSNIYHAQSLEGNLDAPE